MPETLAQSIGHALETLFDALDYDEGNQQARWSEEVERRLKENGLDLSGAYIKASPEPSRTA